MMRGREGKRARDILRLNPDGMEEAFQFLHLPSQCLDISRHPQCSNVFSLLYAAEIRDHHKGQRAWESQRITQGKSHDGCNHFQDRR